MLGVIFFFFTIINPKKNTKMKKFLALLPLFIGLAFSQVKAQTSLQPENWTAQYVSASAADTVGAATVTTWNKGWFVNKGDGLFYNAKVKVSDKTAGATCTIALQGKYFADDAYTTITTMTWRGGGTDTTVLFTSNSTKVYYNYFNVLVTRTANVAKIDYVKLSLKK